MSYRSGVAYGNRQRRAELAQANGSFSPVTTTQVAEGAGKKTEGNLRRCGQVTFVRQTSGRSRAARSEIHLALIHGVGTGDPVQEQQTRTVVNLVLQGPRLERVGDQPNRRSGPG